MSSPLCHFEIRPTDVERGKRFYGSLFAGQFDDQSMPGYTLINTGEGPGGGMLACTADMPGPSLAVYFRVDDIPATIDKAVKAGGRVQVPETPIPNVGTFAVLADPDGVTFGIFKPLGK